jgi:hypothetical protein
MIQKAYGNAVSWKTLLRLPQNMDNSKREKELPTLPQALLLKLRMNVYITINYSGFNFRIYSCPSRIRICHLA